MSQRVIDNPAAAGWELDTNTGYWMWAAGGGSIQDGDTEGQITTWDGDEWTPEGAVVVNGGSVGIGTDTPLRKLHISEDTGAAFLQVTTKDDTSSGGVLMGSSSNPTVGQVFYNHSTDSMRVVTSGEERMIIDDEGFVFKDSGGNNNITIDSFGTVRITGKLFINGEEVTAGGGDSFWVEESSGVIKYNGTAKATDLVSG